MKRFFLYLSSIIRTIGCVVPLSSRRVLYAFYPTTLPNTTISTKMSTTIPTSTAINSAPHAHNLAHPHPLPPPPLLTLRNSQFAEHLFFTVTYLIIYTYITPQMYSSQRPTIIHFRFDCKEHLLSENDEAKAPRNISSRTHTHYRHCVIQLLSIYGNQQ